MDRAGDSPHKMAVMRNAFPSSYSITCMFVVSPPIWVLVFGKLLHQSDLDVYYVIIKISPSYWHPLLSPHKPTWQYHITNYATTALFLTIEHLSPYNKHMSRSTGIELIKYLPHIKAIRCLRDSNSWNIMTEQSAVRLYNIIAPQDICIYSTAWQLWLSWLPNDYIFTLREFDFVYGPHDRK